MVRLTGGAESAGPAPVADRTIAGINRRWAVVVVLAIGIIFIAADVVLWLTVVQPYFREHDLNYGEAAEAPAGISQLLYGPRRN